MSPETAKGFHDRLENALVQRLWDQWGWLGAPTATSPVSEPDFTLDVESLILATLAVAEVDPRLQTILLEWLAEHGSLVSIARLKRVKQSSFPEATDQLSACAAIVSKEAGHANWKSLIGKASNEARKDEAPKIRGLGTTFDPHKPGCLTLKLRALFGVGSRADIISFLLCSPGGQGGNANIARETGWFVKTVQKAVAEMAQSGHVRIEPFHGRHVVRIHLADWKAFAGKGARNWIAWNRIWKAHLSFLATLGKIASEKPSPSAARFLAIESYRKEAFEVRASCGFLVKEAYEPVPLADEIEHFIASIESGEKWPVGATWHDPNRVRFVDQP